MSAEEGNGLHSNGWFQLYFEENKEHPAKKVSRTNLLSK